MAGFALDRETVLRLNDMLVDYERRLRGETGTPFKDPTDQGSRPTAIVQVTGNPNSDGTQAGKLIGLNFAFFPGTAGGSAPTKNQFDSVLVYGINGALTVGAFAIAVLCADVWVVGSIATAGSGAGSGAGSTPGSVPVVVSGGSGSGSGSGGPGQIQVVTDIACVNGVLNVTKSWIYGAFA
jgi:hypothetical protein